MKFNGNRLQPLSESQPGDRPSEYQLDDHLSEHQIDEQLMGDLAAPAAAHLANCKLCASLAAEAAAPIVAFKAVTAAWSERRSATLPLHQTLARSAKFHPRLAWAAAVAAALAVGVAIPVVTHQLRQESARIGSPGPAANAIAGADANDGSDNAASDDIVSDNNASDNSASDTVASDTMASDTIARDNQMLMAIDRELDASVESPEMLGLQSVSGTAQRKSEHLPSVRD